MRLLLNKTNQDFDLTDDLVHDLEFELSWDEFDFWMLLDGELNYRSDPDFLEIVERYGSNGFRNKWEKKGQRYEIVELDIPEDEIDDYFIDENGGFERILKRIKPTTIKEMRGEIE